MLPPSVAHNLNQNNIGDIRGDFLSNNTTHIYIHNGEGSRILTVEEGQVLAESSRIPIVHINELNFVRSRVNGSDLAVGDGFHIHAAKYQGKVVAVKVYQGLDSVKRLEADLKITSSLFHPTMLRPVAVLTATATPLIVFSGDNSPPISSSLGGFKSLTCCLADALGNSEVESLMLGAQLLRDVSSGLDYFSSVQQTIGVSGLTFDLLVDENDNICITVGVGEEDETGGQGHLDIFHSLCYKSLLEANNECHFDKSQAPTTENSASGSSSHPELRFSPSEDEPIAETDLQSDCPPTPPRREYAFVPDRGHQSLREISTSYARFMRIITKKIRHLRRKGRGNLSMVAHRCPGYRRDMVTLGTSVLRTAIIQHLTPSPTEICPICQQLVEDGTFNCFCGQGDDGISSTIQCSQCRVWSHRPCQVNGDSMGHFPLCARCLPENLISPRATGAQFGPQQEGFAPVIPGVADMGQPFIPNMGTGMHSMGPAPVIPMEPFIPPGGQFQPGAMGMLGPPQPFVPPVFTSGPQVMVQEGSESSSSESDSSSIGSRRSRSESSRRSSIISRRAHVSQSTGADCMPGMMPQFGPQQEGFAPVIPGVADMGQPFIPNMGTGMHSMGPAPVIPMEPFIPPGGQFQPGAMGMPGPPQPFVPPVFTSGPQVMVQEGSESSSSESDAGSIGSRRSRSSRRSSIISRRTPKKSRVEHI